MINYYQMFKLLEAKASDDVLWKYYYHVEKEPNIDDLRTLISMIEQSYSNEDRTGIIADFLGGINYHIIPKLSQEDQKIAKDLLAKMKVHSRTDTYMRIHNYKSFDSVQEFEEFILNCIEHYNASSAMKAIQDPANKYWWEMVSDEIKIKLKEALIKEHEKAKTQPSFGKALSDIIKKHIKDNDDDDDMAHN